MKRPSSYSIQWLWAIFFLCVCAWPMPLSAQGQPDQEQNNNRCRDAAASDVVKKLNASKIAVLVVDHTERSAAFIHCVFDKKIAERQGEGWAALKRKHVRIKEGDTVFLRQGERLVVMVDRTNTALYNYAISTENVASEELQATHSFLDDIGFYLTDLPPQDPGKGLDAPIGGETLAAQAPNIDDELSRIDNLIGAAQSWIMGSQTPLFLALNKIKAAQAMLSAGHHVEAERLLAWNADLNNDAWLEIRASLSSEPANHLDIDSLEILQKNLETLQKRLGALAKEHTTWSGKYGSDLSDYNKLARRLMGLREQLQRLEEKKTPKDDEVKTVLAQLKQYLNSGGNSGSHSLRDIQLLTFATLNDMVNQPDQMEALGKQLRQELQPDFETGQQRLVHVEKIIAALRELGRLEPSLGAISANIKARNTVLTKANTTTEEWNKKSEDLSAVSIEINRVVCEIKKDWKKVAKLIDAVRKRQEQEGIKPLPTPGKYEEKAQPLECMEGIDAARPRLPDQPLVSSQFVTDTKTILKDTEKIVATVYDVEALALKTINATSHKVLEKSVYASISTGKSLSLKLAVSSQQELARLTDRKPFVLRPLDFNITVLRELISVRWPFKTGVALRPRVGLAFTVAPGANFDVYGTQFVMLPGMGVNADTMMQEQAFAVAKTEKDNKQVALTLTMGFEWHRTGRIKRQEARRRPRVYLPELMVSLDTEAPSFGGGLGFTYGALKVSTGYLWVKHAVLDNQEIGQILRSEADLRTRNTYRGGKWYFSISFIGWPPFTH